MIKTILFDFDGTLVNTNEIIKLTLNEISIKYAGKELVAKDFDDMLGKPLKDQMAHIYGLSGDKLKSKYPEFFELYRELYNSRRDDLTKEFDGVVDMLEALYNEGIAMGIVSSKGTDGIRHGLEKFGLSKYFSIVLSKYDVENNKPHPEGLFKAMKYLDSSTENTIFVGDSSHDLLAAKNAGVPFVLVAWTIAGYPKLKAMDPEYIIESPMEMMEIIKACGKTAK
jgi:pyrophosphatase PpaX